MDRRKRSVTRRLELVSRIVHGVNGTAGDDRRGCAGALECFKCRPLLCLMSCDDAAIALLQPAVLHGTRTTTHTAEQVYVYIRVPECVCVCV